MLNRKVRLGTAVVVVALLVGLLAGACTGAEGKQGPKGDTGAPGAQGPKGDKGDPGPSPSAAEVQAAVEAVLVGEPASAESIARGGRLYDKWWKEGGLDEPAEDQPLWATQDINTRSGSTTWRCKECHGWDYKGAGGAYSSGSHKTGFPGVYRAGTTMSKDELLGVLQGSLDYRHDFSAVMGADDLNDLVNFLSEGLINQTLYIDYATKAFIGADAAAGKVTFDTVCSMCHGADGKQIPFHDGEGVGGVARDNPWESLHKVANGQPATGMSGGIEHEATIQDLLDVLGYAQTLGAE